MSLFEVTIQHKIVVDASTDKKARNLATVIGGYDYDAFGEEVASGAKVISCRRIVSMEEVPEGYREGAIPWGGNGYMSVRRILEGK